MIKNILMLTSVVASLVVSFSAAFYFVARPVQMDRKLSACTQSAWDLHGNQDDEYAKHVELCVAEFKH